VQRSIFKIQEKRDLGRSGGLRGVEGTRDTGSCDGRFVRQDRKKKEKRRRVWGMVVLIGGCLYGGKNHRSSFQRLDQMWWEPQKGIPLGGRVKRGLALNKWRAFLHRKQKVRQSKRLGPCNRIAVGGAIRTKGKGGGCIGYNSNVVWG